MRNHPMAPIAVARHKIGKRWYGNVLTDLQAIILPNSDSSGKRQLPLCSEPAQHFTPSGASQGIGSNQHTIENWGTTDELKRWNLLHTSLYWSLVLIAFPFLCRCASVFFFLFLHPLFLVHLQEFVNPAMNLSLKNYTYENTGFTICVRIGGKNT